MNGKGRTETWLAGLMVLSCAVSVPVSAQGKRPSRPVTPGTIQKYVVPADTVYKGMSYGEWGAAWWQWVFAQPIETNPTLIQSGTDPMTDQGGPVYFLTGIFGGAFPSTIREATIPPDTSLFFPVVNVVWTNGGYEGTGVPEAVSPTNFSVSFMKSYLGAIVSGWDVSTMYASLDGVPIARLEEFRAVSPVFAFENPSEGGSLWSMGQSPQPDWVWKHVFPTISDGYWLMLRPLPAGKHVLKFGQPGMDVTYNLTVLK